MYDWVWQVWQVWLGPNGTVRVKSNENILVCENKVQKKERFWDFYLLCQDLWKNSW